MRRNVKARREWEEYVRICGFVQPWVCDSCWQTLRRGVRLRLAFQTFHSYTMFCDPYNIFSANGRSDLHMCICRHSCQGSDKPVGLISLDCPIDEMPLATRLPTHARSRSSSIFNELSNASRQRSVPGPPLASPYFGGPRWT